MKKRIKKNKIFVIAICILCVICIAGCRELKKIEALTKMYVVHKDEFDSLIEKNLENNRTEFNELHNKIFVSKSAFNKADWYEGSIVLNGKNVIKLQNLRIYDAEHKYHLTIERELFGNLVFSDEYDPHSEVNNYPIYKIKNDVGIDMFEIGYNKIWIYEDDVKKVENFYSNSNNQFAYISYVKNYGNNNLESRYFKCNITFKELLDIRKHYDSNEEIILIDLNDIDRRYSINIESYDRKYNNWLHITLSKGKTYLSISSNQDGEKEYRLTEKESKLIKGIIDTYVDNEEYRMKNFP